MKTFFKNPNPVPGGGPGWFADVEIHLPTAVKIVALVSSPSGGNFYLHLSPSSKVAVANAIPVEGAENWIPMLGRPQSYSVVHFAAPKDTFYVSGDSGGSGAPADFALLLTDEICKLNPDTLGSSGNTVIVTPNPLPVTGPLTAAQLAAAEPLAVTVPLNPTVVVTPNPLPVTGPLTAAQLTAAQPLAVNETQQAGVVLSAPIADAPVGTETAPVVRAIQRKKTTIETTTPLAGAATFTGAWHDAELDGTLFVILTCLTNVAAGLSGMQLQESDDTSNAGFTRTIANAGGAVFVNVLTRISGAIKARYWRVTFQNGAGAQASLEISSCAFTFPFTVNEASSNNYPAASPGTMPVSTPNAATSLGDNLGSLNIIPSAKNELVPLSTGLYGYGGAFSGAANAALQGWSKKRTPTVFKHLDTTATGPTALWTPGSGNKFRILKVWVTVSDSATLAVAGRLQIQLYDGATLLPLEADIFVPSTAIDTSGALYDRTFDLGSFGILSATANNVLNVVLSVALTAGNCQVIVAGTEE